MDHTDLLVGETNGLGGFPSAEELPDEEDDAAEADDAEDMVEADDSEDESRVDGGSVPPTATCPWSLPPPPPCPTSGTAVSECCSCGWTTW